MSEPCRQEELVDVARYNGGLRQFVPQILELHRQGKTPREIYHALLPLFRTHPWWSDAPPSDGAVRYILVRIGALGAEVSSAVALRKEDRAVYATALRSEGVTLNEIGRRIGGVSAEMVRKIVVKQQRREEKRARAERNARITAEWATEAYFGDVARLRSKGRPLDMGGPRDQWIERSPWDAI